MTERANGKTGGDALGAIGGRAPAPPPPSPELRREIESAGPKRPRRPCVQLLAVGGISLIYAAAVLGALSLRADLATLPAVWVVGRAGLWITCFFGLLYAAMVPPAGEVMPRARKAAILAAAAALAVAGAGFAWTPGAEGSGAAASLPAALTGGTGCLKIGVAVALLPLALAAVAIRGAVPTGSRWVGFALGVAAGSLAGLVLHFFCGITERMHLGLVHPLAALIAGAVGALIVPRFAR